MNKIAILLTCHNRKTKTLKLLETLYDSYNNSSKKFEIDIFLTDDGSKDGTSEIVNKKYPQINILQGDGNLYWAEGMRNSWKKALLKHYDGYLLLNDDVEIYENVFDQMWATHSFSLEKFNKSGIYIGATEDKEKNKLTYSGIIILNKLFYTQKRLPPDGTFQLCDMANANIMFVPQAVVDKINIFTEGYSHGVADYDYTLKANKNNIPVIIAPNYCGHCVDDHKDPYEDFSQKTFQERKEFLYRPTGLAYKSYTRYMRKFFPFRYPFVVFFGWFKLYFPKIYIKYFRNR